MEKTILKSKRNPSAEHRNAETDLEDQINYLASEILRHKRLYYQGHPEISDAEYDALEDELRKLDPQHPVLNYVGSEPEYTAQKVAHRVPMLSLAKTYDMKELESWINGRAVVGMLKIDGVSLSLIYQDGQLTLAKTRGNGRIGEDVTIKAQWVAHIIKKIPKTHDLEIRGELYCTESSFIKLAQEMEELGIEKPSSPRNIVAGLLGRKTHHHLCRYFRFRAFDLLDYDHLFQLKSEAQKFNYLKKFGFSLPEPRLLKNMTQVKSYLNFVKQIMDEDEIGVDGAVFSYNDLTLHEQLGDTAHHPRYKMAFKWQGETAISVIRDIDWRTSRLGVVTPVAIIEPVYLSSATITNVTLHNAAHVKTFNLKPGDKIEIVRSGEVIPKFLRVVDAAPGSYQWPTHCPECNAALIFDDVRLRCPNRQGCPAQRLRTILNWIESVEIDDLSEKRLEQLIEAGLVKEIPDLYQLTVEDFLTLPNTKEKMATKLYENIQKSKHPPLARFLLGLGIEGAGLTTWEKLIEKFPSLDQIQNARIEDIIQISGFAEKSARQIVDGLQQNKALIRRLLNLGITPIAPTHRSHQGPLAGMQFVITGALSEPREKIVEKIKQAGGKVTDSVSKHTTAIITNDPNSESSKMRKARQLGIPIWSEETLHQHLHNKGKSRSDN